VAAVDHQDSRGAELKAQHREEDRTIVAHQDVVLGERGVLLNTLQQHVNSLFTQPSSSSTIQSAPSTQTANLVAKAGAQQSPLTQPPTIHNLRSFS